MKIKLIALVLLGAGATSFGLTRTASTLQKKPLPPYKDRLKSLAKEAKTDGRKKIGVPSPVIEYLGDAGTITAEEAFTACTVAIAHLISTESYDRDDDIFTWNKFVIHEVLSEAKELPCPGCGPSDPPAKLLPLLSGEFVIPKIGGTINIDGVEIEQSGDGFPAYELNQKYLLLLNLYPNGTASTIGGPVGVFRILDNKKVVPVKESDHSVWRDANHNGISEASELHTLNDVGLRTLALKYKFSKKQDEYGNNFRYRAKVFDMKGQQVGRWAWDVYLLRSP